MTKSSRPVTKAPGQQQRRRPQAKSATWLPWILGAVAVVAIAGVAIGRSLLGQQTADRGPRAQESFRGVSGYSFDNGATQYIYPDPASSGASRQWLPALGREDAPVVVIEYSDIYCSHCRTFNLRNLEGLLSEYVATGQVRYVGHFFGFPSSVQQGVVLAEMCAAEQGRYFEFRHSLFQTIEVGNLSIDQAARIAGLDTGAFADCRSEQRYSQALQEIVFVENQGVNATPTFFINGEQVSGNLPDRIRELIEQALTDG
jgi:protein-disulfide isomerase